MLSPPVSSMPSSRCFFFSNSSTKKISRPFSAIVVLLLFLCWVFLAFGWCCSGVEVEDVERILFRRPAEKNFWNPTSIKLSKASKRLKVTFNGPAKNWTDAIPIGNGRLGAMVWGDIASETIQLNEDTLWTGFPGNYTNPNATAALSEVRRLVDNGEYAEATKAAVKLSDSSPNAYQPLGDINLQFDYSNIKYTEGTYYRELDLDSATARVKYTIGDVEFTREHFVSNPNQVFVTKISGSKPGSLSFNVSLDSRLYHQVQVNAKNQIIMQGYASTYENPNGIRFAEVLDLQINQGGVVHTLDDKKLKVQGSDWAVLLLVASSSFDGPFIMPSESHKNPTSESLNALKSIKTLSYSELYAHHLDDYQNLFHRVSLQLSKGSRSNLTDGSLEMKKVKSSTTDSYFSKSEDNAVSTAERVKSFQTDEDPSFVELLFQYGRYLLISSSRPGTQVSNLQGIWNKDTVPPWQCAPHLNINLQMNYSPSLSCNLKECQEPLFDLISSLSVNGRKTAKVNYGANGWVAHQVTDIWAKTSPDQGEAVWALWPMGGAWLCTHLWEHYTYTMDNDFLNKKAYPLLESCTSFLLDWLIDGPGEYLETNPSTSPEHMFVAPDGKPASVSYSSTMDIAIIREVFSDIVSAAEVLGKVNDVIIEKVHEAQTKLPPTKIAKDDTIMEWALDCQDPDVHHRHLSHLFGLFPGHTITVEKTPELCKAAENTLLKRGEDGPGWSTTWKIALWAHLHNSDHAYRMVKHLINLVDPTHEGNFEGGLYSNLFTAHPPFQIDANFGFSAAIAEMLVQSTMKDLYLLPALPKDKWPNGCVKGLKARGAVTVNVCWQEGELVEFGVWSVEQNSVKRLHYKVSTVTAKLSSGKVYTFNRQLKCVKTYSLSEAALQH